MINKELLDYFIDRTDARFDKIDERLDSLNGFKWKTIGFSSAIVLAFSAIGFFIRG